MVVSSLRVVNLRSYESFSCDLDEHTTLILGNNGTGKTSLLEAIYFLMRGTSFRGRDRDMIQHNSLRADIKIEMQSGESRRGTLQLDSTGKITKEFLIEGKKSARLGVTAKLPVVIFEPDELRLLSSSPQRRRDFFDGIIARLSPTYSTVLSRYARTLAQRNELLKQYEHMQYDAWQSHLFAWNIKLAELGATIIRTRSNFLSQSNQHLSRLYSNLASTEHTVVATYDSIFSSSDHEMLQQQLLSKLEATQQSDALRGFTSVGPHRDDITITLNSHPAADTASRGEMRTIMLAFKLLEIELQEHHSQQKPVILLDDVFSELDITREQHLMNTLKNYQTIITATDLRSETSMPQTTILNL